MAGESYRDEEALVRLYVVEERSIREVARELDTSHRTVERWLSIHGIPTRDHAGQYPFQQ